MREKDPALGPEHTLTGGLAMAAVREALNDAGWGLEDLGSNRVGVCMGTTVGSAMNSEDFYRDYRKGCHPDMAPIRRFLDSNPAALVAREFGLDGPCQTIVNACSSGTDAVGVGVSWIRAGVCDVVIAGGADELCRTTYNGFVSLMIMDENPCRPFDRDRRGLNLGEGAAALVLESEDTFSARKIRARSFVLGFGAACDAYHLTAPKPDGMGLKKAIADAMEESDGSPGDVAFVNAHGTGTPDNDRVESHVLDEMLPETPFLSTKGYTGHTLGAAGAIEAALTVAFLEEGRVPASVGFTNPDPGLPASPLKTEVKICGNRAMTQSLAFGGHNSVLIIGRERDRT